MCLWICGIVDASESDYLFKLKCGKFFIKSLCALAHGLLLCKRIYVFVALKCVSHTQWVNYIQIAI